MLTADVLGLEACTEVGLIFTCVDKELKYIADEGTANKRKKIVVLYYGANATRQPPGTKL